VSLTLQKDLTKTLTEREKAFADLILSNVSSIDAYKKAYHKNTLTPEKARSQIYRILSREHVKAYIQKAKEQSQIATVLNLIDHRSILKSLILDASTSPSDKIKAIVADANLAGYLGTRLELATENGQDVSSKERLRKASIADKVAMLRQAREQDKQASQGHFQTNPEPDQPANTDVSPSKDLPLIEAVTWQPDPSQPAP